MSAGRLSSVLFPAFLWLAAAGAPRYRAGWIAGFAAFQAFNAALFYSGALYSERRPTLDGHGHFTITGTSAWIGWPVALPATVATSANLTG